LLYAASTLAFVGGSLVPKGGHNPLEPAALALPVLMGPSVFNFAAIAEQLLQTDAMLQINSADDLANTVILLLQDTAKCKKMGEQGLRFVAQNRGAVRNHLLLLEKIIPEK